MENLVSTVDRLPRCLPYDVITTKHGAPAGLGGKPGWYASAMWRGATVVNFDQEETMRELV